MSAPVPFVGMSSVADGASRETGVVLVDDDDDDVVITSVKAGNKNVTNTVPALNQVRL